jgi:hypothetical protein
MLGIDLKISGCQKLRAAHLPFSLRTLPPPLVLASAGRALEVTCHHWQRHWSGCAYLQGREADGSSWRVALAIGKPGTAEIRGAATRG